MGTFVLLIFVGIISVFLKKGIRNNPRTLTKRLDANGYQENEIKRPIINNQELSKKIQGDCDYKYQLKMKEEIKQDLNQTKAEPQKPQQSKVRSNLTNEGNAQKILNGIIWSEIIGEPRSKKPHFSRKGN